MAKGFLKNDIEEANRFLVERSYFSSIESTLHHHIERLRDELAFRAKSSIYGFFHNLRSDLKLCGLANRVAKKNISDMTEALRYSARAGYLLRLSGGEQYSGGYDCMHVFDLLVMSAVSDLKAINVLTSRFKAPFKNGHPHTILLCNAVYMALNKHPDPDLILRTIESSKPTKFFLSMFRCLAAVNNFDMNSFLTSLMELLKGNRRQDFHSVMEKAICIEAHAMVNLWNIRHSSKPIDLPTLELPWDTEFHEFVLNKPDAHLTGYNDIPTTLNTWIELMPSEINIDDILSELNENPFKKLARWIRIIYRNANA